MDTGKKANSKKSERLLSKRRINMTTPMVKHTNNNNLMNLGRKAQIRKSKFKNIPCSKKLDQ